MIEFYIINTCDLYNDKTVSSSMICREEGIGEKFYYSFLFYNGYLKKHISKNFADLVFKNGADCSMGSNNRIPIKELIDDLYVYLFAPEDIDLSLLHHCIRKV